MTNLTTKQPMEIAITLTDQEWLALLAALSNRRDMANLAMLESAGRKMAEQFGKAVGQ